MLKNYYAVRSWLEGFIPLVWGKEELGLARIENLLKKLGNQEKKFKSIHVAGTSGKGSTAFYIAQLLRNCKLETRNSKLETNSKFLNSNVQKVSDLENSDFDIVSDFGFRNSNLKPIKIGLHISPHLVDFRERMQIFESQSRKSEVGSLMLMGRFLKLFNEIKPVVEKIKRGRRELTPSYFEILVAASFKYFAEEKVDWAVVEVGLGGGLDATNVLTPEVSVITNVGLDHTEILGRTVEKIAYEKAGIIKPHIPVVIGASGRALRVIAKVAKERGSSLIKIDTQNLRESAKSELINAITKPIDMFGYIPAENIILGVKTLETLKIPVNLSMVEKVLQESFPGRFEWVDKNVLLDGAHNPDKIKFLIRWIKDSRQLTVKSSLILVLAFKRGKDWKKMIDLLVKNLPVRGIIATKYQAVADTGLGSAVEPGEIARYVKSRQKGGQANWKVVVESRENSQEAVFERLKASGEMANGLLLITGSLYLVGEVRTMWNLPEF